MSPKFDEHLAYEVRVYLRNHYGTTDQDGFAKLSDHRLDTLAEEFCIETSRLQNVYFSTVRNMIYLEWNKKRENKAVTAARVNGHLSGLPVDVLERNWLTSSASTGRSMPTDFSSPLGAETAVEKGKVPMIALHEGVEGVLPRPEMAEGEDKSIPTTDTEHLISELKGQIHVFEVYRLWIPRYLTICRNKNKDSAKAVATDDIWEQTFTARADVLDEVLEDIDFEAFRKRVWAIEPLELTGMCLSMSKTKESF